MPRRDRLDLELSYVFQHLKLVGEGAPSVADKVNLLRSVRSRDEEAERRVDEALVRYMNDLVSSVKEAMAAHEKLKILVEKLTSFPWHPATFLGVTDTRFGEAAVVHHGNTRRVVTIGDGVDLSDIEPGDEVLLGPELNVVVDPCFDLAPRVGECAEFDRLTPDGRVVLRFKDEEILATQGRSFDADDAKAGDTVRWDRDLHMAFEKIERSRGDNLFLEETPKQTFDDIGGLDTEIEMLKRWIWIHRDHADLASKYHLRHRHGAILIGPPGNGKTMLARAFARHVADVSASGRSRFMNIKPSALHSMWYGQSEANYREAFRVARKASAEEPDVPVVMFFDEIDSVGMARGSSMSSVNDRVLPAFMAELDGLDPRGNVIVLAASNRADVLDPALLRPDRLGDDIVQVSRPNRKAAGEIMGKYVSPRIPVAEDGVNGDESPHQVLIDSVLARIYASNGESKLATIRFRDGTERAVTAADLISGAVISKIVSDASERACLREIDTGEIGLRLTDLLTATEVEFERTMRFLTPRNCHKHIDDLPQDLDVVSVLPVERRTRRTHRYLRIA